MARLFLGEKDSYVFPNYLLFLCKHHKGHILVIKVCGRIRSCRIRSPPSNLNFQKNQIGGKDMEGKRPKRRKDKYNPYTIYERNGHHFV